MPQAAAAEAAAAKEAAAAAEAAAKEAAAAAEAAAKEEAAAAATAAAETVAEEVAAVPLVDGRTASNTFEPVSAVGSREESLPILPSSAPHPQCTRGQRRVHIFSCAHKSTPARRAWPAPSDGSTWIAVAEWKRQRWPIRNAA